MESFVVIYYAPLSVREQAQNAAPEDMQASMQAWGEWAKRCGESLTYPGSALMGGLRLTPSGSSPGESDVIGYSVLQAESMEAATALLESHPHIGWGNGCEIELYRAMPMPI